MKTIKTYQQALDFLGNKRERPYAHNTRIVMDSLELGHEVVTVTYHGNPVVSLFPDGTTAFNSCGWKTSTTKERINWFLPEGFYLYQTKSVWYISNRNNQTHYVFADGITIKDGTVYNAGQDDEDQKTRKQIKRIKHYVEGYVKALLNGEVESPSGGDCWFCVMRNDEGKNLGELTHNLDHIESHLEESYYVPSLLVNAIGYKPACMFAKGVIGKIWQGEKDISAWEKDILTRDVKSSLTAYIKHLYGMAA